MPDGEGTQRGGGPNGEGTHMHNRPQRRSTKRTRQLHNRSGAWLCELREKHGLSQRELANRVGAEFYTVISQLEAGLGRIPPDRYLVWADALGVEPREFVRTVASYYEPVTYDIVFGTGPRSGPRTRRLGGCA